MQQHWKVLAEIGRSQMRNRPPIEAAMNLVSVADPLHQLGSPCLNLA
jgi:hypothetical protein